MTDILDRVSAAEMRNLENALNNQRGNIKPIEKPLYIKNKRCCIDCCDAIPIKRLQVYPDAVRCIWCQQDFELKKTEVRR